MTTPSPLESRLAIIERNLAALSAELAAIRAELSANPNEASTAGTSQPLPPRTQPPSLARSPRGGLPKLDLSSGDVERLLGRYGMLGIAVLAAVAAVGTFLSWAISHGYLSLGPGARVLIGLAFAVAIGVWGMRLRRSERSFGSSMLGLALVIVQVCAYAAGPAFHLVPIWLAFVGATVTSWALAVFAHGENEEPLWCVGFGGAAVAPFVTSSGPGNVYALVAYGAVLLVAACFAINRRAWPIAWRVFYLASALFVIAASALVWSRRAPTFLVAFALPFVIGAAGVLPFAPQSSMRGALRWLALLAVFATLAAHPSYRVDMWTIAGAFVLAAGLWLLLVDRQAGVPQSSVLLRVAEWRSLLEWIDAAVIPSMFSLQATKMIALAVNPAAAWFALALVFVAFAWRRTVGSLRDAAALAAVMFALGGIAALSLEFPLARIAALVALGLATLELHKVRPTRSWLSAGAALLIFAAVLSATAMLDRPAYRFVPFATEESAAALVVALALVAVARYWRSLLTATRAAMGPRPEWTYAATLKLEVQAVTVAPWLWMFTWVLIELSMAFSASASMLLLVTYFAATAVGCVAAGRARRAPRVRQLGLGLALVSAATAVYGASTYFDFAARIAAYLVTSAFLLGIAYWYRRPGATPAAA